MGANLGLWTYRLFTNDCIYFEEVLVKSYASGGGPATKELTAGQKAAITRRTGVYSWDQHVEGKPEHIVELATAVEEFMMGLDPAMEEAPKKNYIAYRMSQNIVCMETQQKRVLLYLKLDPKTISNPKELIRDVSDIGHFGTGNLEVSLRSMDDFETAKPLLVRAYERVGG